MTDEKTATASPSLLDSALAALARGFAVFPCHPRTKKPAVPNGVKDATRDEARVRAWWARGPDCNPAVTGGVIVDCDRGLASADEALAFLASAGLPPTLAVRTGRRDSFGVQFHFTGRADNGVFELGGVGGEVRCANQYGMAPGSVHPISGERYEVLSDLPRAAFPAGSRLAGARKRIEKPVAGERIAEDRNIWLASQAGRLVNAGLAGAPLRAAILALNLEHCDPPLAEREIDDTVLRSAARTFEVRTGDAPIDSLQFLKAEAPKLYKEGVPEPVFFLWLYALNQGACKPPLGRSEVRAVSIDAWEKLSGEAARALPGDMEAEEQTDTDTGFGKHFVREHGAYVRYSPEAQAWLCYRQGAWRADDDGVAVSGLVKETFIERQAAAEAAMAALWPRWEPIKDKFFEKGTPRKPEKGELGPTGDDLSVAEAWTGALAAYEEALAGQSARRVAAALEMARTEDGIAVASADLDAHPLLFNAYSDTLDLSTGEARAHRLEDLITQQSLVDFNPGAPCRQFEKVLARSLPDEDVREYLRDFLGLCLSGLVAPDILIFLGEGANGKGLVARVMTGVLGSYAAKCSMTSFVETRNPAPGGARSDLSALRGKRLVTAAEANRKVTLDMELLKDWTGGEDFSARDLWERARKGQFRPQGKLVLSMNHPPRITDQTHATWRRLRYIRFDVTIPAAERDDNLAQKLLETEGGGILNWALRGWARVARRLAAGRPALDAPASVLADTAEFKDKENQAARFWADELRLAPGSRARSSEVYARYRGWCARHGEFPVRDQTLTLELQRYARDAGMTVDWGGHNHHTGWHRGLALRASREEDQLNLQEYRDPGKERD